MDLINNIYVRIKKNTNLSILIILASVLTIYKYSFEVWLRFLIVFIFALKLSNAIIMLKELLFSKSISVLKIYLKNYKFYLNVVVIIIYIYLFYIDTFNLEFKILSFFTILFIIFKIFNTNRATKQKI